MTNQIMEELEVASLLERIGISSSESQVKDISDPKDNVTLYHTETGEPRTFPKYMAAKTAKKKLPNGKLAFTDSEGIEKLGVTYTMGTVKCRLHAEHPDRAMLDSIGLRGRTCPAGGLASAYDMNEHMRHKHRRENAIIQEHEGRQREDAQLAAQAATQQIMREQVEATIGAFKAAAPKGKE